jgi:hypothetical protein
MVCLCLEDERNNPSTEKATEEKKNISLSTQFYSDIFLQTILISLEVNWKKWTVTVTIDTGAQRSSTLKKTALKCDVDP